ncbi:MAG: beta-lactamase family protein [Saprospiraceae bacterium]|nr:beta-lactamase family protein [Candidatus Vicinibacter affinis]
MKIQFLIIGVMMVSANVFTQDVNTVMFQKLDSLLSDAYDKGIFTGQVILSHRTKQIYYRKYGYADWNTKREMDPKKLFNIGSLNKQFTEEIIHQLVQEGHLQYQDKLSKYIDVIAADNEDKITVEMLLDMKAGLGDYLRNPKFRKIQQTDFSLNELIEIIKVEPLLFEPGTQQEYSNSGYAVLGALIEKVTGKSYEENLLTRIAKPLGISEIYYARDQKSRQVNRAFGHLIDFDGKKEKCG